MYFEDFERSQLHVALMSQDCSDIHNPVCIYRKNNYVRFRIVLQFDRCLTILSNCQRIILSHDNSKTMLLTRIGSIGVRLSRSNLCLQRYVIIELFNSVTNLIIVMVFKSDRS